MDSGKVESDQKKSRMWLWIFLIIVILVIGFLTYFLLSRKSKDSNSSGQPVLIPEKILNNKFGFLGGGEDDKGEEILARGAAWVRPHPGAFVWDMMQKEKAGEIDFSTADQEIKNYQAGNLGILATLWPFADWDQKNLTDAENCKVDNNDEFLPKNDKKGRGSYLPQYRCNPSDWVAYQKWVEKVVERYDGDGKDDMAGLKIPVKYWEVMNEPDLQYQNNLPANEGNSLNFYKQGPAEYAKLLVETSKSIKISDSKANVLIAGAAGADERMLNFYRDVLKNSEAKTAFDIGNVHCISNDRQTHDFNVGAYKKMLAEFSLSSPIWVTEAEAMYGKTGEENYESTKVSTIGAINAGAQRIFFTRYEFDDTRTDMSKTAESGTYPSAEKYKELIKSFGN